MTKPDLTRRTVLGVLGAGAATVLAACGGDSGSSSADATSSADSGSPSPSGSPSAAAGGGDDEGSAGGDAPLVAAADVPVGSGIILKDQELVVTQPTKGTFLAFSAICTHQGCPVGTITGDEILCPCHGSVFSAQDGSVVQGPANGPLAAVEVTVKGGQVRKA